MERPRDEILSDLYRDYCARMGDPPQRNLINPVHAIESVVPHPRLRLMLQSDEAVAALLPISTWKLSLGDISAPPFCLHSFQPIVRISPALLDHVPALATAARWGLELARIRDQRYYRENLPNVLYHGNRLLAAIDATSRNVFLSMLPEDIAAAVWGGGSVHITRDLIAWLASLAGVGADVASISVPQVPHEFSELSAPLEHILISGGDSRLLIDPTSGYNRYGVPPRPRPDAVHFSSSTASAISDYGFAFCELLRADLQHAAHRAKSESEIVSEAAHGMSQRICLMLGLSADGADVAITASGTDAEIVAVLLGKAGDSRSPLTNVLIAPDETGSGVALAGAGCYFDSVVATGAKVEKGASIWCDQPVSIEKIAIRGPDGAPRAIADVDDDFVAAGSKALARGHRVLAHVLLASKTGLCAPSTVAVNKLIAIAPDRVDVVVDACQMRMSFKDLGSVIDRGWMLQISGSKFLTGPPFSGALVLPHKFRNRLASVQTSFREALNVCHGELWSKWWADQLPRSKAIPSYGPLFRWLPALLEARLLDALSDDFRRDIFERFRDTLVRRIEQSPYLRSIAIGTSYDKDEEFARLSIVSFQVIARQWNGELCALEESECRHLFEQLNRDVSHLLSDLTHPDLALAKQKFHIGQPVTLHTCSDNRTVLRLVIGARFFTIVGYAEPDAIMAALDSEMADAARAIAKIEMLAARWWRFSNCKEAC